MVKLNWKEKKSNNNLINSFSKKISPSLEPYEIFFRPLNEKLSKYVKHPPEFFQKEDTAESKDQWKNLLFWGNNKTILLHLLRDFKSQINLIYFDPPFATGGDFNYKIFIGEGENSQSSKHWIREQAYNDKWKQGIEGYLNFMQKRLLLMRELLADTGSIYVHLDWHISHYIKILMDEIFGESNFRNELIWFYPAASAQTKSFFVRSYDSILYYSKTEDYIFNDDPHIYMEYSNRVKNALQQDDKGYFYYRGGSHDGKKLSRKVYVKNKGVFPRDVWMDIPYIRANTLEYQGFSTQKPERLLKRIILASSRERDLVADFFCGSGTTLAVAEKLDRRWIGCDLTPQAIHITKKRLLDLPKSNDILKWKKKYSKPVRPFMIQRLNSDAQIAQIPSDFLKKGVKIKEILEKYGIPVFKADVSKNNKKVSISLIDYEVPFSDSIAKKVLHNIASFSDWIDYWAVDFSFNGHYFHTMWVAYRTHKDRILPLAVQDFEYKEPGEYDIGIKVIDIFGIENEQVFPITIE
ncbi:MAG: site-specific DNA-methyltransferase [Promethearchaeota archaeon]|nr:MAG: site-specific DNA-methyltransferase [Candidatus Lokiarchaeota archaeon]